MLSVCLSFLFDVLHKKSYIKILGRKSGPIEIYQTFRVFSDYDKVYGRFSANFRSDLRKI